MFQPKLHEPASWALRSLEARDVSLVCEIEREVYSEPWSEVLIRDSLYAPMTYSLGLVAEDRIFAYAIFQVIFGEAHLLNLAVKKERQSQGWGGYLLDQVLFEAKRKGGLRFFLEVRPSNLGARKLYARRDFKVNGRREHYYADGEDALIMVRDL